MLGIYHRCIFASPPFLTDRSSMIATGNTGELRERFGFGLSLVPAEERRE